VITLVGIALAILLIASLEAIFLWYVGERAAQVEPLKRRVIELEDAERKLVEMGKEIADLQVFERQLRRVLSASDPDTAARIPWQRSSPLNLDEQFDQDNPLPVREFQHANRAWPEPASTLTSALPTYPPVRGYITRKFSSAGPFRYSSHRGLDIAAREGTPVLAAADGIVLFSGWTFPYGRMLLIAHPSDYSTFYGHNQSLLVAAGERVIQGQPIGLLGNSGRSTAPHLHYEIWKDDHSVDPLSMLTFEE
jgi:murein DD-endopeptidase MepM/ murein hydrolase activator NlpD